MKKRQISWEIIVCGLLLTGLAIYLVGNDHKEDVDKHIVKVDVNKAKLSELSDQISNQIQVAIPELSEISAKSEKAMEQALKKLEASLKQLEDKDFLNQQQNAVVINVSKQNTSEHWIEQDNGDFVYQITLNKADMDKLALSMDAGHITIDGTNSKEGYIQFKVEGKSLNVDDLEKYFTISQSHDGSQKKIRLDKNNANAWNDFSSIKAIVKLPVDVLVDAETNGGHILLTDVSGDNNIRTKGGHITLNNITGSLIAQTKGGHIEGDKLNGQFDFKTNGGHLTFEDLKGSANLKTNGGHITLKKTNAKISAGTSGGNISAELLEVQDKVDLQTSAGNITLQLPENSNANLDIKGTRVKVSSGLKSRLQGTVDDHHINAYLNEQGPNISAKTSVGFVTVNSGN